jgi:hypothetical protein
MTQPPITSMSEEDVLLTFSAEESHDRVTLEAYLVRYPEHAEALVELATELMLVPHRNDQPCADDDPAVNKAWDRFRAALPLETKSLAVAHGFFENLTQQQFRDLAKALNVNSLFLSRIRDRTIEFATIPAKFLDLLAKFIGTSVSIIAGELGHMATIPAMQKFKSHEKPAAFVKMSFAEAVKSSGLTEQQRAKLEALMD